MKKINTNLVFASIIALLITGITKYNPTQNNDIISVTGKCSKKVKKDKFGITIQIKNLESDSQKAMVKTLKTYNDVSEFLKNIKQNNPDMEVETTEYTTLDKVEWNEKLHKSEKIGVEVIMGIGVTTSNPKVLSEITAALPQFSNIYTSGLNNFVSLELYNKERDNCLAEAVRDAQSKASAMANAVNQKIGKMTNINYNDYSGNSVGQYRAMKSVAFANIEAEIAPEAEFLADSIEMFTGSENISLRVDATFELKK